MNYNEVYVSWQLLQDLMNNETIKLTPTATTEVLLTRVYLNQGISHFADVRNMIMQDDSSDADVKQTALEKAAAEDSGLKKRTLSGTAFADIVAEVIKQKEITTFLNNYRAMPSNVWLMKFADSFAPTIQS